MINKKDKFATGGLMDLYVPTLVQNTGNRSTGLYVLSFYYIKKSASEYKLKKVSKLCRKNSSAQPIFHSLPIILFTGCYTLKNTHERIFY